LKKNSNKNNEVIRDCSAKLEKNLLLALNN
jgi:hypothetical protein